MTHPYLVKADIATYYDIYPSLGEILKSQLWHKSANENLTYLAINALPRGLYLNSERNEIEKLKREQYDKEYQSILERTPEKHRLGTDTARVAVDFLTFGIDPLAWMLGFGVSKTLRLNKFLQGIAKQTDALTLRQRAKAAGAAASEGAITGLGIELLIKAEHALLDRSRSWEELAINVAMGGGIGGAVGAVFARPYARSFGNLDEPQAETPRSPNEPPPGFEGRTFAEQEPPPSFKAKRPRPSPRFRDSEELGEFGAMGKPPHLGTQAENLSKMASNTPEEMGHRVQIKKGHGNKVTEDETLDNKIGEPFIKEGEERSYEETDIYFADFFNDNNFLKEVDFIINPLNLQNNLDNALSSQNVRIHSSVIKNIAEGKTTNHRKIAIEVIPTLISKTANKITKSNKKGVYNLEYDGFANGLLHRITLRLKPNQKGDTSFYSIDKVEVKKPRGRIEKSERKATLKDFDEEGTYIILDDKRTITLQQGISKFDLDNKREFNNDTSYEEYLKAKVDAAENQANGKEPKAEEEVVRPTGFENKSQEEILDAQIKKADEDISNLSEVLQGILTPKQYKEYLKEIKTSKKKIQERYEKVQNFLKCRFGKL